jgi:hypothetical protein
MSSIYVADPPFYQTFNSGFFLSLGAVIFGFLGVVIKTCYQSKCRQCRICYGMINVERDVEGEEKFDITRPIQEEAKV